VRIAGDDRVTIGARTTVSQGTTLLTSRVVHPSSPVVERGAISIGSDAWIAADAMVMPGVRIGRGSVVGARSVVQSDLQEYEVAVGHPVRTLGRRKLKSPAP
jgi:acetyltransferase-like isoleucine patch superfamily enzyme